ncbi:MAG: hypothetical protein KatS3mg044_0336 [Rhodothermaceae bacterium]|nr:MAG: hypothetical protein D6746_10980 [Bacteroidota bacterium]GIV61470.1 MAG: hypothetical protein KatS3mg044_0336 [Rhodothermaceae bacterium]
MPPDTLASRVRAGRPLILALPDSLGGHPVIRYAALHVPAMSRLEGRSFLWRTFPADAGTYHWRFAAERPAAPPETLVVRVDVLPDRR